jgi:hypothetical protein
MRLVPTVLAVCIVTLLGSTALAKPLTLAVQGRVLTAGGTPAPDAGYPMALALYDAKDAKKALFQEFFLDVPVSGGLFGVTLGLNAQFPLDTDLLVDKATYVGVTIGKEAELPRQALHPVLEAVTAERAHGLYCSACLDGSQLAPASVGVDKLAAGSVTAEKVAFTYAGSSAKGGAAYALECAACVGGTHVADHAIGAAHLVETYAGSASAGGPANHALVADALACTGCVTAAMLEPTVLAPFAKTSDLQPVAFSGDYKDLAGGPDLSPYAKLASANTWAAAQALKGGGSLGAPLDFARNEAKLFRFQNATAAPTSCDAGAVGLAYYNTSDNALYVCNGKVFVPFATAMPLGSEQLPAKNCKAILDASPGKADGAYFLDPDGDSGPIAKFQAWCDMTTDGGGWTLVANVHGSKNNHVASNGAVNLAVGVAVPYEATPDGRKLPDATVAALGQDGVVRVNVGVKASPTYRAFFKYPGGFNQINFSCSGSNCPRIVVSHAYPYAWESSPCTGLSKGYQVNNSNYWVYDMHDNAECGALWSSSKYGIGERVLYYYSPAPGGIYSGQYGYTWVR